MTEAAADRAKCIAYVIQALQLDPTRHSDAIVAARHKALGLHAASLETTSVDVQQNRQLRQQATTALQQVRQNFWKLTQREANAELDRIAAFNFKELAATLARLRLIALHRQSFHDLAAMTKSPPAFVDMLQDVFVLAPRDSADLKESIRLAFRRPLWRRTPIRLVKALKSNLPELYQLEDRWLNSLLKQRLRLLPSMSASGSPSRANSPLTSQYASPRQSISIPWWAGFVLAAALSLLRWLFK